VSVQVRGLHGKCADMKIVIRAPNGSHAKLRGRGPHAEAARQDGCRDRRGIGRSELQPS